jgi:hypothetical protein
MTQAAQLAGYILIGRVLNRVIFEQKYDYDNLEAFLEARSDALDIITECRSQYIREMSIPDYVLADNAFDLLDSHHDRGSVFEPELVAEEVA